jgi:AcrR family transcriptional regulator
MVRKKRFYDQPKLIALEAQYQMPIRSIVADLFSRHNTLAEVAGELGVTRVTLYTWLGSREIAMLKAMSRFQSHMEDINPLPVHSY